MCVISALRRLEQKDLKFEASLVYIVEPCLKKKNEYRSGLECEGKPLAYGGMEGTK
jgi:hypothetical protein